MPPGPDGGCPGDVCWSSAILTGRSAAWIWARHFWNVSPNDGRDRRSYSAGEVGSRAAYSRIAPLFQANRSQVLDFALRRERLDPFFPEFLSFCRGRKIDLKIVSDGLDVYIEAILGNTVSTSNSLEPSPLSGRMTGSTSPFLWRARSVGGAGPANAPFSTVSGPIMTGSFTSATVIPDVCPRPRRRSGLREANPLRKMHEERHALYPLR